MIEEIKDDAKARMGKSIEALKKELGKIRTGRAHTSLLDHIGPDVPMRADDEGARGVRERQPHRREEPQVLANPSPTCT